MTQVGRYQILEELGRGATGVVYRALDPAIGRTIAIKSIRFRDFSDAEEKRLMRERLLSEAKSAGVLSHPNVVTIYDVLDSEDVAYIFMEFVDGASLADLLRRGALPERQALLDYLRQIAEALDYAHRKGIVHRDIKPANIMISGQRSGVDQVAKITDFGVAKFVSGDVTNSGMVIGTPNYMSPEQIQRVPVGGASDQFSLAVLVYELLCGEKPFTADNLPALCYAICKQPAKPVYTVNPSLDETVEKVMERAMAKLPEDRFPTCGGFIGALSIALGECPEWRPLALPRATRQTSERTSENGWHAAETPATPLPEAVHATVVVEEATPPTYYLEAPSQEASLTRKVALLIALLAIVGGAVMLIVRLNSSSGPPVQVADPRSAPSTPPPEDLQVPTPAAAVRTSQSTPAPKSSEQEEVPTPAPQPALPAVKPVHKAPTPSAPALPKPLQGGGVSDVELVSDPPGARVVIDRRSDLSCVTPCSLMLQDGRHTLSADENGYGVARKIFTVPAEDNIFVSLAQSLGVLLVTSQPSGSRVSVDGRDYGTTPVKITLPAGRHHLSLSDGTRRHDETIEIDADGVHARSFRW